LTIRVAQRLPPVIGHRGAAGCAPENTLASLRAAADGGAAWVEFDVRLSRDGQAVLFHDDRLERTTNGLGRVADCDLEELKRLDAGGWFGPRFRGERIPTLVEAIATLGELGLGANVEIKADLGREAETARVVTRILAGEWPADLPAPLLSSFATEALAAARTTAPLVARALLVTAIPPDWRRRLDALGCCALHCSARRFDRAAAGDVIARGIPLRCYTVNEERKARRLFAAGVESVFSDCPGALAGKGETV
jgi:glycerophosphoryl diester phosphodiesterase